MSIPKRARFELAEKLLQSDFLNEREKDFLKMRLGLLGCEPTTLQKIGDKYAVTRERVRQIGVAIIRKTKKFMPDQKDYAGKLFTKTWEAKYMDRERRLVKRRAAIKRNRTMVRNRVKRLAGYIEDFGVGKQGKEIIFKTFKVLRLKLRRNKSLFEDDVLVEMKNLRQRWKDVREKVKLEKRRLRNEKMGRPDTTGPVQIL